MASMCAHRAEPVSVTVRYRKDTRTVAECNPERGKQRNGWSRVERCVNDGM